MKKCEKWTTKKTLLCPSILSSDLADIQNELDKLEDYYDLVHCDVMDGSFVPPITFGAQFVKQLSEKTNKALDVHLMVSNPEDQIEQFAAVEPCSLVFHREASNHPQRLLARIRELGFYAGISINPATPLADIKYLLPDMDMLLLMTVNPGYGGQKYIKQMTEKVQHARHMIDESGFRIRLQVDGGISRHNVAKLMRAGADTIVSGSAIFSSNDPQEEAQAFYEEIARVDQELSRV